MTPAFIPKGRPIPEGVRVVARDARGVYVLPKDMPKDPVRDSVRRKRDAGT